MSSTDDRSPAAAAFEEGIVPLAQELRDAGRRFFPLGPDATASTYFEVPRQRVASEAALAFPVDGPADFAARLEEMWREEGSEELLRLVPHIAAIGTALAEEPEVQGDEISPFIYTMF